LTTKREVEVGERYMRKFAIYGFVALVAAAGATQTTPEAAAFFNDGMAKANAGRYEEAVAAFEKSLTEDPNLVEAHEWIAHIFILQGDYDDAIERYQRIVARNPSTDSKVSLGLAYLRVGDVDMAVKTLSNAVAADPSHYKGWNNLSLAYLRQGKVADARAAAERAVELEPSFASAHVNLGNVELREGAAAAAVASFEKAVALDADQVEAYFGLAGAYDYLGEEGKAGDSYVRYLKRAGQDQTKREAAVKWLWEHGRGAEVPK
jgi:Tfp pilus assembly protein PilF